MDKTILTTVLGPQGLQVTCFIVVKHTIPYYVVVVEISLCLLAATQA